MPVLDTSFLIDLQEGLPSAVATLHEISANPLLVPVRAAQEFAVGFDEPRAAWELLETNYQLVFEDKDLLVAGAALRLDALRAKRKATWGDIAVAIVARTRSDVVVTADVRDFKALGCQVLDYRKTRSHSGG